MRSYSLALLLISIPLFLLICSTSSFVSAQRARYYHLVPVDLDDYETAAYEYDVAPHYTYDDEDDDDFTTNQFGYGGFGGGFGGGYGGGYGGVGGGGVPVPYLPGAILGGGGKGPHGGGAFDIVVGVPTPVPTPVPVPIQEPEPMPQFTKVPTQVQTTQTIQVPVQQNKKTTGPIY